MKRKFQWLLCIVTLITVVSCNAFTTTEAPITVLSEAGIEEAQMAAMTDIEQALQWQADRGMYGVFLLQRGDTKLIHGAYGWQDRENQQPMTIDTGFDIGSMTKAITAATIFKLEELGKLQTTQTVGQFFPQAPTDIQAITLGQLLRHTSGLSEYLGDDYDLIDRDTALSRIFATPLQFAPGTREAYSNIGYTLLAIIIEKATQLSYEQAVREAVFIPAETLKIGYTLAGWTQQSLAVGYKRRQRWGTPLDHSWLADGPAWTLRGNGGMLATTDELAQWFDAVFSGRVLGSTALEAFSNLYVSRDEYGLRIGDAGGNDVFNSMYEGWVRPGVRLTFLTSVSSHPAEDIWSKISDEVMSLAQHGSAAAETEREINTETAD